MHVYAAALEREQSKALFLSLFLSIPFLLLNYMPLYLLVHALSETKLNQISIPFLVPLQPARFTGHPLAGIWSGRFMLDGYATQ